MPKYLVFGAGGQLGSQLVEQLEKRGASVRGVNRDDCDITAQTAVARVIEEATPQVVFNAAGFTDIDRAESVRSHVMEVNGIGAGIVAAHTRRAGAKLVHFSSHYVFGEGHSTPIDEARTPAPVNNYGRSKLWGEELARLNCPRSYVVRCPALYSVAGNNIVSKLIELVLAGKKTVTAIDDEFVSPTPTFLIAQTAIDLAGTSVYGTYHASASGACSWFEFLTAFFEKLEIEVDVQPITQERWGAAARRPRFCALENLMLRTLGLNSFPHWEVALDAFLEQNGEQIIWKLS